MLYIYNLRQANFYMMHGVPCREVAEMMGINHWEVLRKLDGTIKVKGIIPILTDNKIVVSKYFIQSRCQ